MEKEQLLQELSEKINTGKINREEVLAYFEAVNETKEGGIMKETRSTMSFSVTKLLYGLGAVIVVVGIVALVSQVWSSLGSSGHIIITLGIGILTAVLGSILLKSRPEDNIGIVFHFIGGVLIPGGAVVTLSEMNIDLLTPWPFAIIFGVVFALYLLINAIQKNIILMFFAITNGTIFIYLTTESITSSLIYNSDKLYAYLTMAVGASYLLLAHAFREGRNKKLVRALCLFGVTGFLGAAFSQVYDSVLWQVSYFVVVAGGLALSVYMRSRIILIMGALFLVAHIIYITSEYFADSIGWPISLVILGFLFIGLGYVSININRKYIAN
ncbi:MAG: hypothetical protein KC736_03305 [Candidatus Moranbacteria bacterium]|nr:hypothetical protein [Candidatus Moranbacteria bacterium]